MPTPDYDFLIIGQGLAGSILAHNLISAGQRVLLIDQHHYGSASQVAAGIINPITGHRLNLTSQFEDHYRIAKAYYAKLEYHIKATVLREIPQQRLIKNPSQYEFWQKRLNNPQYQAYLGHNNTVSHFKQNEHGVATIFNTAVIDTKKLLQSSLQWFTSVHSYRAEKVDYALIKIDSNGVRYADVHAKSVIFCEGHQAINNPWLTQLPFKLAKGEILTLELPNTTAQTTNSINSMLSWGNWLVPHHRSTNTEQSSLTAKLGSNYAWNNMQLEADIGIKEKLLGSLQEHTAIQANVIKHEIGIRPCTTQRLPFVGPLSNLDKAYCFNGFGSKGCLIIPFYAQLLCDHLLSGHALPNEVTQWL